MEQDGEKRSGDEEDVFCALLFHVFFGKKEPKGDKSNQNQIKNDELIHGAISNLFTRCAAKSVNRVFTAPKRKYDSAPKAPQGNNFAQRNTMTASNLFQSRTVFCLL